MTIGISKERLIGRLKSTTGISACVIGSLINECTELDPWLPIESAPTDREILVYAPPYQDLRAIKQVCRWHESAGFCIDELRTPTHYKLLPDDPK